MKAYVLTNTGPQLTEVARPACKANEVVIRVRACGLNRVDLAMSRGHVHGNAGGLGNVLGVEWAGDVIDTGIDVKAVKIGDRVMCSGAGAFAEYAVADCGRLLPIPEKMNFEQAASLPVALQTMHDALMSNGQLQRGDAVLIQGASSGVGLMAMQIAKHKGARCVIGTSTSHERRARLHEWGADVALDSRDPTWVKQVLDITDGKGVDLVIDQIAGDLFEQTMQATRIGGRIVNVGRLGGHFSPFNFDLHALRRLHYVGVTFRTRSRDEVRTLVETLKNDLWGAIEMDKFALPIDKVFSFDDIAAALDYMSLNRHFGKIIVRM